MSDSDKRNIPFWKWWIHKSASSPSLSHKSSKSDGGGGRRRTKATGTGGRRSRGEHHDPRNQSSLEEILKTPKGVVQEESAEDLFLTTREFFSNVDLHEEQEKEARLRDVMSSEELRERSFVSQEDVEGGLSRGLRKGTGRSSGKGRRALSTPYLSGKQSSAKNTQESKSASNLELKRSRGAKKSKAKKAEMEEEEEDEEEEEEPRKVKSKRGKGKQEANITLTKRTMSLTEKIGKEKAQTEKKEDKPYTNDLYKGFDVYQEIEDEDQPRQPERLKMVGEEADNQTKGKEKDENSPLYDTIDAPPSMGRDPLAPAPVNTTKTRVYNVLTPTEIYQRRSSTRNTESIEEYRRNRSASDFNPKYNRSNRFPAGKQRSASVTDEKPILQEKQRNRPARKRERSLFRDTIWDTILYDRPGDPIPIYQSPPPPREVAGGNMSSFQPLPKESNQMGGEDSPKEKNLIQSNPPQEASPSNLLNDSLEMKDPTEIDTNEEDLSSHSTARRTQSEQRPSPMIVRQHQQVKRSHSEPRAKRREEEEVAAHKALTQTQSDALQPIIDDHLVKHNKKVLEELGIDLAAHTVEHKPAARVTSTSSTLSTDSSKSSLRPRPASLAYPGEGDFVSPLSEFGPNFNDPRTRLSYNDPPFHPPEEVTPPYMRRSASKPVPPRRSPSTRLSSIGQHSPSSHSSDPSTPRSSPLEPRNIARDPRFLQPHHYPRRQTEVIHRASSLTSVVVRHETPHQKEEGVYGSIIQKTKFRPMFPGGVPQGVPLPPPPPPHSTHTPGSHPHSMPFMYDSVPKPQRWSFALAELSQYQHISPPGQRTRGGPRQRLPRRTEERDMARAAVKDWVLERLSHVPPEVQSLYYNQQWVYRMHPSPHPTIPEELEDEVFDGLLPRRTFQLKTKSSSDSDHSVGGLRTASLDRLGRRSNAHPAHAHTHTPHYTLPRRPPATHSGQRYHQPSKGKGYGYSPPSAVFDDDPGIMSEAETSSTGFRRGGKQRTSLPVSRTPSAKTLDSRFEPDDNSYWDEDPGIMSEAETSSTGRGRNAKPRTSLPIVRTPSKTLERPLGLVFLQYRGETKRALLPNEITSLDTVKALFVRSFPNQLSMQYLDLPSVKIYIHDSNKDMFYDLEDLRDIRDRSVLRVFEGDGVNGGGGGAWGDQDNSYFSEPEFDSNFQHQHVHKAKNGKTGGYFMTHSYPPGAPAHTAGVAPIPRGPRPPYSPADRMHGDGYLSSPERSPRPYGGPGSAYLTPTPSYEDPYYGGQYGSRSGSVTPIIDEDARSAFYSMRVEQMERQLASLTGLVKKALHTGVATSPLPEHIPLAPPPAVVAAAAAAGSANSREQQTNSTRSSSSTDFLQVPTSTSYKTPAEKQPIKPAIKCSTLPRMSSQDMRLSPEVYNQLRVLQKKAKELRTDVRNLRRTSQANALTMKEILRETITKITTLLQSTEEGLLQGSADAERVRIQREEESYRQDMSKLDKDLCDLELKVEELRNNVINRRLRVNMTDVENMALILSRSSKTVADLKAKFPILQDGLKGLIAAEMERAIGEEKFLKEEPDKLESALRRCKKLTGTLVTLKRLASVQEQRIPPNPGSGPNAVANGDPRSTSPTHNEDTRPSSSKVCVITPTPRPSPAVAHSITHKGHPPLSRKKTPTSL